MYILDDLLMRISKTSSVLPAAQQQAWAAIGIRAASTRHHGCDPSLVNAPSRMPNRLHEIH